MGYMRHHAILVTTGYASEVIERAREHAIDLGMAVTPIVDSEKNGVRTFVVVPDGSKEGWETSDQGDQARDALIEWMNARAYEDGSCPLDWCEVQYGDDDGHNQVLRTDDDTYRAAQGI